MARKRKVVTASGKSQQVHFWVSDALTSEFGRVADSLGERLTDAHRSAMQYYVDQNSLEGAHFLFESEFALGRQRLSARVFAIRPGELVVRLRGDAVESMIELTDRLGSGGLGGLFEQAMERLRPRAPAGRRPL